MSITEAVFLGILQGLTEFLPVSSSGHLVLAEAWLGLTKSNIVFEVFVHFGTLLAVVVAFWRDIVRLFRAVWQWLTHLNQTKNFYRTNQDFRLVVFILIGSIPAAILGLFLQSFFEAAFSRPFFVSWMLVITGIILLTTHWARVNHQQASLTDSILIGCAQAIAILPGISRSGSTISAGLWLGVEQSEAARFSFLLSLPAVFGATLLEARHLFDQPITHHEIGILLSGTIIAFLSGILAIYLLLGLVRRGKFSYFAFYCFAVGIAGLLYFG